jgi:hypothetical protein
MKNLIYIFSLVSLTFSAPSRAGQELKEFRNTLMPFSSDGCSQFPDSVVGMDYEDCCREHDHAYWKGGTFEQKEEADENLGACVGEKAFGVLGTSMKMGVGIGGSAYLPTTWKWGYGWKISRGYSALSIEEEEMAEKMFSQRPENLELSSPGIIPYREQVSGDYCLDMVLSEVLKERDTDKIEYSISSDRQNSSFDGYKRVINIKVKGCHQPYTAKFLLLRASACTDRVGEFTARGRIRLESFKSRCSAFEKSRF